MMDGGKHGHGHGLPVIEDLETIEVHRRGHLRRFFNPPRIRRSEIEVKAKPGLPTPGDI
jgi:hypothetical protein